MAATTRPPAPAPAAAAVRRQKALDLTVLGLASLALRIPAYLAERHHTFDDGVYGVAALALRDGDVPFRDVFSPQGPAYYPLVALFDLVGGRTAHSPRLYGLLSGLLLVVAVYLAGRRITDRTGALVAAALSVIAGSILWVTAPIAADGPATAFGVAGLAAALAYRGRPGTMRALAAGLLVGLGMATKLVMIATVVPVAVLLLAPGWEQFRLRRINRVVLGRAVAAGVVSVAVCVAWSLPWGPADVVDQYLTYHREAGDQHRDLGANAAKILTTVPDRNVATVVVAASALVAGGLRRRRGEARPGRPTPADGVRGPLSDTALMVGWAAVTLVALLAYAPLFRPHLVVVVPPVALLAGMHRPPLRVLGALAIVVVPLQLWRNAELLAPPPYGGASAEAVAVLGRLPDGAWVISDEPGFAWRTGHRTPAYLVDPSIHRVESGRITTDILLAEATDDRVCAVQVWSHRFGELPGLADGLTEAGFAVVADVRADPSTGDIWFRDACVDGV